MSIKMCPKTNPKIKKMLKDGTIFCFITHTMMLQCSDKACCEECDKKETCPKVCAELKIQKTRGYIQ